METRITEALRANFKPEFLNRIDETIIFHNLTPKQIIHIVDIQIERLRARLAEMNISLELTENAKKYLAEKGYDPVYGARPLKRAIQKYIENPLSLEILQGKIHGESHVTCDVENDQIIFK
jgi:ATP-dependent Clp protease ATP-binding subunit ClpB